MKKDIKLRDGDTITAFEISLTFFIIVRQANNFNFSKFDISNTYLKHLKQIDEVDDEVDKFGKVLKKKLITNSK